MLGRAVAVGLLWPTLAWAAPIFIAGNDLGVTNTATQYWSAIQASPNLASTTVDSTTGNTYSIEISAASGAAEYVAETISSASDVSASFRLYVPTSTSLPSVRRKVLSFYDTGASKTGCMVTIEADASDTSKYRLKTLYESADNTGGECAASATQDGKECTTSADCDYVNPGEQSCAPGVFATTLALDKAGWHLVTLRQQNGTGEVTCSMWEGAAGTTSVAYQRGSQTRDQGICTGGSVAGNACDDNADCTGGGACTTTDVVTIEQVRFGTDDTETGALTYNLDDLVIDTGTPNPNYRLQTLLPTSDGTNIQLTPNGCTSGSAEYDCINDATPDDDATYVTSNVDGEIQQANVTDITLAGGESVLAVAAVALVRSTGSSSPFFVGLTTTDGTSKSASFDTNTVGTTYHLMTPYVLTDPPGSPTSWTETLVDGIQWYGEIGVGGGQVRITQARVEVLIDQSDPAVPTVIPDRNQDGEDTFCIFGDSTLNDSGTHDLIVSGLVEATNILECARPGGTAGDVTENISIAGANNDLLDGGTTQFMSCRALKGSATKACDVAYLQIGVNTLHTDILADPTNATAEHGASGQPPGFCDNKGGANDQGACTCPTGTGWRRSDTANGATRYCRVKGANWLAECDSASDCTVASAAECCTDCADTSCTTCTNTASSTLLGGGTYCGCSGAFGCVDATASGSATGSNSMCVAGCLNSPQCPGGLCLDHENTADVLDEIRRVEASRKARPTPAATPPVGGYPLIVYGPPPPGQIKANLGAWQDIEREVGNLRTSLLAWARTNSVPWIDMYGRFLSECPGGAISGTACQTNGCSFNGTSCTYDRGCCLRDEIHWNNFGQQVAGNAILTCLTNSGGTTDGVCTTGICTAGKVNEACSANADCATWVCDLGVP